MVALTVLVFPAKFVAFIVQRDCPRGLGPRSAREIWAQISKMSEDHMDEFEHYNYEMDKHVNLSGHSGMYFYKIQHNQVEGKSSLRDAFKIKKCKI